MLKKFVIKNASVKEKMTIKQLKMAYKQAIKDKKTIQSVVNTDLKEISKLDNNCLYSYELRYINKNYKHVKKPVYISMVGI